MKRIHVYSIVCMLIFFLAAGGGSMSSQMNPFALKPMGIFCFEYI